jgi:hypothetical protein
MDPEVFLVEGDVETVLVASVVLDPHLRPWRDHSPAARLVLDRHVDFAFTQTPILPYIYGIPQLLAPGLLTGRITSLVFGVITLALAMHTARREAGDIGGAVCGLLISSNLFALYYLSISKTYALGAFWIVLALTLLSYGRKHSWAWAVAGAAMGLAVGTRLSALPVAAIGIALLAMGTHRGAAWRTLAGFTISSAVIFGPFLVLDAQAVAENIYGYHSHGASLLPEAVVHANRVAGIGGLLRNWGAPLGLLLIALVALGRHRIQGLRDRVDAFRQAPERLAIVLAPLGVLGLHLLPAHPQVEYQTLVGSALALSAGAALRTFRAWRAPWVIGVSLVVVGAGFAMGDAGRWDATGDKFPLEEVGGLADELRRAVPGEGTVLTMRTVVAVEAHRRVPPGLEMGIFSYFPDETADESARFHRANDANLHAMVQSGAYDAIVIGEMDLAMNGYMIPVRGDDRVVKRRKLLELIRSRYQLTARVEKFGQWHENMDLYVLRTQGASGGANPRTPPSIPLTSPPAR